MSASLVGSEMCIRDSFSRPSKACLPACPAGPVATLPPLSRHPPATLPPPCLLYTSDAADDM
eukprot:1422224-Alexandrium_andersonii.AAC.1